MGIQDVFAAYRKQGFESAIEDITTGRPRTLPANHWKEVTKRAWRYGYERGLEQAIADKKAQRHLETNNPLYGIF